MANRKVRENGHGSGIFEVYAILWKEELDAGAFDKKTKIEFVKRQSQEDALPQLPVIMHFTLKDNNGFLDAPVGDVISSRFTSKGLLIQFMLITSDVTESLIEDLSSFLGEGNTYATVTAFQNSQVGVDTKGRFTDFPVAGIYLYVEDQVEDGKEEEETETDPT